MKNEFWAVCMVEFINREFGHKEDKSGIVAVSISLEMAKFTLRGIVARSNNAKIINEIYAEEYWDTGWTESEYHYKIYYIKKLKADTPYNQIYNHLALQYCLSEFKDINIKKEIARLTEIEGE